MLIRPNLARPLRLMQAGRRASTLGPGLKDFMGAPADTAGAEEIYSPFPPYTAPPPLKRVHVETYGCQMNFSDTEIVLGILEGSKAYVRAGSVEDADVVLLMTCAIRENAESKIWGRLDALRSHERQTKRELIVGVLGCMAERLKHEVLERKRNVDVVCGPDAYRDLPRLLRSAEAGQTGVNVVLSFDETYADVAPVRIDAAKKSAFISIMRGCNNLCTYCIVPFTRGRERSRPADSVVQEARMLQEQGVREITLLGQNVNSYLDTTAGGGAAAPALSAGFTSICRPRQGGLGFPELLDRVSAAVPGVRIRFTSPHPKDFPDDLLHLMRERSNICKQIHLPAQSGSSAVLDRMRRGYTREAYLRLVERIRGIMPEVTLSSDFIVGFCGETEQDHRDTLALVRQVDYDMAYMFAYSLREKTAAHRRYADDVPEATKQARLRELIDTFYGGLRRKAQQLVGRRELVLVEGPSRKDRALFAGRSDGNRSVVFSSPEPLAPGAYVDVLITHVSGATPVGRAAAQAPAAIAG